MKLQILFQEYLTNQESTRSSGSYRFAQSHCKSLLLNLDKLAVNDTKHLKRPVIDKLISQYKASGLSMNTIDKRICLLKRIVAFGAFHIPGVSNYPHILFKRSSFQVVHRADLTKLLQYFRDRRMNQYGLTRYLVFMLLLYTGCRSNELINIRCQDIDFDTCSIVLNVTKTGCPRIVFFNRDLEDSIRKYIAYQERDLLYYNFRYNKPLTIYNVYAILRYAAKVLGIKDLHPHMLRHTMATMLVEAGAPIVSVQYILGHKSSKTTDIYLHMSSRYLKKSYDEFYPKI